VAGNHLSCLHSDGVTGVELWALPEPVDLDADI
jgi:hypothetical protein